MTNLQPTEIKKWHIYKIENPDGRVYIGRTINIEQRRKSHFPIRNKKINTRNKELLASVVKFGAEAHSFSILEEFESDVNYADGKEMFWIRSFMCNRNKWPKMNGFNLTDGGIGIKGMKFSETSKQKMSDSGSVKIFTESHRSNLSKSLTGLTRRGKRAIIAYHKNGHVIGEYVSMKEASKILNISTASIWMSLNNRTKRPHKYIFKYKTK